MVLTDPQVSRRHAAMRLLDSGPAIEDLGSSNGTFVNEQRVQGTRALAPGDTIRFGATVWRLRDTRPAPPPPPPAARGDVPPPPEVAPSAVHRVLPPTPPGEAGAFHPTPPARPRGSAATRVEATIVCFAIVAATAIALILYFALYEP